MYYLSVIFIQNPLLSVIRSLFRLISQIWPKHHHKNNAWEVIHQLIFRNRYDISNFKPIFLMYLFRGVLCLRGTYEIIFTFFGAYMVQKKTKTCNLDPITPFQADFGWYCSWYQYSEITIFFFGAFQNQYCNPFCKIDTIYWFIVQHYWAVQISRNHNILKAWSSIATYTVVHLFCSIRVNYCC